jgi:hypothetical protein
VQGIKMTPYFSPTAIGGHHSIERISFRIKRADQVTVTVVDDRGNELATLMRDRQVPSYLRQHLSWNGLTDAGTRAPDGVYRVRVRLLHQGRSVLSPRSFRLDTTPPRPRVIAISPAGGAAATAPGGGPPILPLPGGGPLTVSFTADAGGNPSDTDGGLDPQVMVYRTDVTPAQLVANLPVTPGSGTSSWDGTVAGQPAPAGVYLVAVRSRDPAGNFGSSPPVLPPTQAPGRPLSGRAGITVRYLGVQPPIVPAAAGAPTAFGVDARQAPYRWSLRRVGAAHPRTHGSQAKPILIVSAPRGDSGVYVLQVQARGHSTAVPLAVQGSIHEPVLVVLPAITWLGQDAVDEDGDGLPDTLAAGLGVRRERIFASGLPSGFHEQVAPVLAFLDRQRLRYDVTTDVALAANPSAALAGHSGVLLPGDERWLPVNAHAALRRFVRRGGRLASLGSDTLRRAVTLNGDQLTDPRPPAAADALGATVGAVTPGATTVVNFQDMIGLFSGGDGRFAGYTAFEPTVFVGPGAQLLSSAVTASGQAVVVAARLGKGIWLRTGLPEFGSHLQTDPNSAALMTRLWQLLAGKG